MLRFINKTYHIFLFIVFTSIIFAEVPGLLRFEHDIKNKNINIYITNKKSLDYYYIVNTSGLMDIEFSKSDKFLWLDTGREFIDYRNVGNYGSTEPKKGGYLFTPEYSSGYIKETLKIIVSPDETRFSYRDLFPYVVKPVAEEKRRIFNENQKKH